MPDDTLITFIAILGGLAAGIINTLAGNGSAITLGIMTELMGLAPNVANGTNRVGIMMQGITSTFAFIKNDKLNLSKTKWILTSCILGAILGVLVAINVSNEQFHTVFRYLLVVMLFVILINPKRWLISANTIHVINHPMAIPLFFALGFYGGFIQMGMGVVFLATTVLILKYDLISANVLKTFIVAAYTILALAIFHFTGFVDWKIGLTIGIGQAIGGYVAAEFASKYPRAQIFAYVLLVVMVVLAILSTFGILDFKI